MGKRLFEVSALIVLILFFIVGSVFAFPNFINYQGQLTDSSGNPLNGDYILTFMIYGEETEGEALWTEQHTITVANGLYNAELGTVNPFPEDLFETEMLYLEVIIHNEDTGSDETLSPRIPFTSTGFSMKAKDAETVAWPNISDIPTEFSDNKDDVNDADADPANEIQTLGVSDNNIMLSKGGGSITVPYAANAATAYDADKLDGKDSSNFGDGHSLDAADGGPVDVVYVDSNGNVGIGTKNPMAMLEVDGGVYFEGGDGDVNFSGEIGMADFYLVLNYLLGKKSFSREEFVNADVDGDGRVTYEDLLIIFYLYFGISRDEAKRRVHSVYGVLPHGGNVGDDIPYFYVTSNVAIGPIIPTEKLEVDGTVKATAFVGDGSSLTGISSDSFVRSTRKPVIASYSPGFVDPGLITDGVFAPEGTGWSDPNYAVKLNSAGYDTNLKIDLGAIYDIYRLRVQADCNDDYRVEYSMDDSIWNTLYDLPRVADGGLRTRDSSTFASVKARYLRIYAFSGDGAYSVSEVEFYAYGINITDSGNVGIGTNTPNAALQIIGAISRQGTTLSGVNNDTHVNLGINSFTDGNYPTVSGGYNNTVSGYASTVSGGENNTASNWDSTVSGGINNTASGYISTVSGGYSNIAAGDYSWAGGCNMQLTEDADRTFAWGYSDSNVSISTPDSFIIYSGNVGIGTMNPGSKLNISGGNILVDWYNGEGRVNLGDSNHYIRSRIHIGVSIGTSNIADGITLRQDTGNVGIGTTTPSRKLDVAGDVIATAYEQHSDARLKKNIAPIDNALDKVAALQGVEFEWRKEEYPEKGLADGRKIGLIAQEVDRILPEVVSTDDEGYKSVEYANMVGLLIEAIKAQQLQIEELKSQNTELKERVEALERQTY